MRDRRAIELHAAVALHGDNERPRRRRLLAGLRNFRHVDLDVALHLIELRRHHEENDQQEQHVDHRREIQRRRIVVLSLEAWHRG